MTTAATSSRSPASTDNARISSSIAKHSAFIFGRSRRSVPTPSATSSRANSPIGSSSAPQVGSEQRGGGGLGLQRRCGRATDRGGDHSALGQQEDRRGGGA